MFPLDRYASRANNPPAPSVSPRSGARRGPQPPSPSGPTGQTLPSVARSRPVKAWGSPRKIPGGLRKAVRPGLRRSRLAPSRARPAARRSPNPFPVRTARSVSPSGGRAPLNQEGARTRRGLPMKVHQAVVSHRAIDEALRGRGGFEGAANAGIDRAAEAIREALARDGAAGEAPGAVGALSDALA